MEPFSADDGYYRYWSNLSQFEITPIQIKPLGLEILGGVRVGICLEMLQFQSRHYVIALGADWLKITMDHAIGFDWLTRRGLA